MKKTITEARVLAVRDSYDVIVVGAGIGGVAAAIAARRNGARVLLVEKSVALGGQATIGLIHHYLPLCDGNGHQVLAGIAEELLHLSIKYGYDTLPEYWKTRKGELKRRYATAFSPAAFIIALDELIVDLGIDLLFDTLGCRPVLEDGAVTGMIVEDKAGRGMYECDVLIDGTGDADLFRQAGVRCIQGVNHLTSWSHTMTHETIARAVESERTEDGLNTTVLGAILKMDGSFEVDGETAREYRLYGPEDVTRFVLDSRRIILDRFLKRHERDQAMVTTLPSMPLFRTTYRIPGRYTLSPEDLETVFDDSVGCACDWRRAGPVYEIPYRSLCTDDVPNLLACGRCIASEGDTWEVTRVIPVAAVTGQAAGTAAALAVDRGISPGSIDILELQDRLRTDGVFVSRVECLPSS